MITTTTTQTANETNPRIGINISQHELKHALNAVLFAIDAPGSFRYGIDGVRVEIMPGEITFIGTDGKQLSYVTKKTDSPNIDPYAFSIPGKLAKQLAKMPTKNGAVATLIIDQVMQKDGADHVLINAAWTDGKGKPKSAQSKEEVARFPKWQRTVTEAKKAKVAGTMSGKAESLRRWFEPTAIDLHANGKLTIGTVPITCRAAKTTGEFRTSIDPVLVSNWLHTLHDDDTATLSVPEDCGPVCCSSRMSEAFTIIMPMGDPAERERKANS